MNLTKLWRRLGLLSAMTALGACISPAMAQSLTSKGTDFYTTFTQNFETRVQSLDLFISSTEAATGTIEFMDTGATQTFTTAPNQILRVQAPKSSQLTTNLQIEKKGIHVQSDKEISLYGLNNETNTTDAFLALPTAALGNTYRVASYTPTPNYNSSLAIVATQDGSAVTITPNVAVPPHAANTPFTITLDRGQTYQVLASSDLTGTAVTSNKPIAVHSGATCAYVPTSAGACDMLVEQMIPTTSWGNSFFAAPLQDRSGGSRYRVMADQADTAITVNGAVIATINAGAFHELNSTEALSIKTSKPALLIQYANGKDFDPTNSTGDPFMMLVPPSDLFINDYTLATADANPLSPRFTKNFIGIVAPIDPATQQPVDVSLDGALIAKSEFTLSPNKDFFYVNKTVLPGSYHIASPVGVGVTIYGFTDYDSYGYVGGLGLAKISNIKEIKLSPSEDVTRWVNTQYCVTALVTDLADAPLNSVKVDVTLSGANPQISSIYTDTTGKAPFCYSSATAGADTLLLSAGGKSATSKVKWIEKAADATLTLTPATVSNPVNAQQCFIATLMDTANQPLVSMPIAFEVAGVNPQNSSAATDSTGKAQLCYNGANAGNDVVSASSGPLKQTASAAWTLATKSQTLSLSPLTLTAQINTTQCFVASLKDASNAPAANQPVSFVVGGVNSQSSSLNTDSNGNAQLCYSSAAAGVDTITATADTEIKSARAKATQAVTATMTWQTGTVSPPVGAGATPVPTLHPAGLALLAFIMGGLAYTQRRHFRR